MLLRHVLLSQDEAGGSGAPLREGKESHYCILSAAFRVPAVRTLKRLLGDENWKWSSPPNQAGTPVTQAAGGRERWAARRFRMSGVPGGRGEGLTAAALRTPECHAQRSRSTLPACP
eukprot:365411-Chlamydomonas_euryale.AAC.5